MLGALARLLGVSDFLWDDFLRMQYANLFPVVRDVDALGRRKGRESCGPSWPRRWTRPRREKRTRAALNAFKDREMFRVDMRHIMGHTGTPKRPTERRRGRPPPPLPISPAS